MQIIDHKFVIEISLLSLKIPVLMFRLTRTVSNMRIAKNNEETDPAYKYTVTRDLYSTIGNNTSDVKIFIIFQHITYGEVAGYSLRDSDSILCWIRSRLLVVGWGARLRIIRCKSAAGAGPLSWSGDQVI